MSAAEAYVGHFVSLWPLEHNRHDMAAWTQMTQDERQRAWDQFYTRFGFRPSMNRTDWPSIQEPLPSVTVSIATYYSSSTPELLERELIQAMLEAFRLITTSGQPLMALDWQHESYWVMPDQIGSTDDSDWLVPVIPNGDYCIFVAADWRSGIFGHPWEETICIFGQQMLDVAFRTQVQLLATVVRRNGKQIT